MLLFTCTWTFVCNKLCIYCYYYYYYFKNHEKSLNMAVHVEFTISQEVYTGCAKKKKDILNIYIKSDGIIIFSQKFCKIESTIFVVKCQKFICIV